MKRDDIVQSTPYLAERGVLQGFPKVELHRHLEGTFAVPTLFRIARRNGLDVPETIEAFKRVVQFPKDSEPDFLKFLSKFKNDWYRSLDDVSEIAYESIAAFKDEGIFYIEVRFSPEHFAEKNGFDRKEVTRLIVTAGNEAARSGNFTVRYLITFNRSKQTQEEMLQLYHDLRTLDIAEIVGVDLAGDETNYPPELFTGFFDRVSKDGRFQSTIHAGEVSPPSQIWAAIRSLNADRIGHGTSAIQDPELQRFLTDHGVVLEQCITSNYQTGSWIDEANHPLGALYRSDVPVTINSDDPFIQVTELTDDYVKAVRYFDLTLDDLVALNETALDGAFLSDDERRLMSRRYREAVGRFREQTGL
jgi:adenosine deaminase